MKGEEARCVEKYAGICIGVIEDMSEPNFILYKESVPENPVRIFYTDEGTFVSGITGKSSKTIPKSLVENVLEHVNHNSDFPKVLFEYFPRDAVRYNGEYRFDKDGNCILYHYGKRIGWMSMKYKCSAEWEGKKYKSWYDCQCDNPDPYLEDLVREKIRQNRDFIPMLLKLGTGCILIEYRCDHTYCNDGYKVANYNLGTAYAKIRDEERRKRIILRR